MQIGKYNTLRVVKHVDFGVYLDGGEFGEILLPIRYVPANCEVDDRVDVFVYVDSEDRIIATTEKPFAEVGDFAALQVKSVTKFGAFLDWGLMKDLLVPFSEQKVYLEEGQLAVVYIYLDEKTNRIVGSAKLEKWVTKTPASFEENDQVEALIAKKTDLGYKAIINNMYLGLIYQNEIFNPVAVGQKVPAFIKQVREDGKIDVRLQRSGAQHVMTEAERILAKLTDAGGFLPTTDKTAPEEIYATFGISKKSYKKVVGELYKRRLITIEEEGIRLVK